MFGGSRAYALARQQHRVADAPFDEQLADRPVAASASLRAMRRNAIEESNRLDGRLELLLR
jgi:hypothetical protein